MSDDCPTESSKRASGQKGESGTKGEETGETAIIHTVKWKAAESNLARKEVITVRCLMMDLPDAERGDFDTESKTYVVTIIVLSKMNAVSSPCKWGLTGMYIMRVGEGMSGVDAHFGGTRIVDPMQKNAKARVRRWA